MAKQRLSLTRDQLASFLKDFEQIKQFESLFATVDNIDTFTLDEINVAAGTANATANEALASIAALSNLVAPLIVAPPPTNGTVTSVAASGGTTGMTFTGSPITTNGTLVLGGTLAIANGGTGATNATDARLNLSAAKSGANSDITSLSGITGSISTVDSITFDTAAAITVGQGQIAWNADDGTIDIGMGYDAVTQQVGLEQYFRIKASATITNGQCIMFTGSVGASGVLKGAPATGVSNPQYVMGVATMDIANNGFGYVTSFGLVRGINTTGSSVGETWVDGDILYYNPAFTGGLTKVPPTAPLPKVIVAAVVNAGPGASGSLFIRVQGEPDLHNLSDVYAPAPISNGQILIGDGPQARWEAATLTPGSGVSITNAAGSVTISATGSGGTVTSVSVVPANGFAGTVATATTTPAITLSTSVTGLVKGNGTALSAAVAATDYVAPSAYASANGLTMATSRLLGRTTASTGAAQEISVAGGLTLSGGVLTGASGTVTSVTGTSPVVSSGGSTPAISMPAATTSVNGYLTSTDWTTFNNKGSGTVTSVSGTGTVNGITLTGTITSSGSLTLGGTLSGVSLTTQVSGTLPIANGGTNGTSAPTAGAVPYGTGTAYAFTAAGTSGQVLTSAGAGVPTWTTPTTGTVTSVSGTGTVNGITLTGTVTSTGSLTLGGTLSGVSLTTQVSGTLPVANGGTGTATAFTAGSVVFAGASGVYTQDNASLFFDDTNNRLGLGTATPASKLDIATGDLRFSGTGQRILGDMSNGTLTNRLSFQTTTANGATVLHIIPNGSGTVAGFKAESDSTFANSSVASLDILGGGDARITSGIRGAGTYLPLTFYTGGSERARIDTAGKLGIGTTTPAGKQHTQLATSFAWGGAWDAGVAAFGGATSLTGAIAISYNDTDGGAIGSIIPGVAWKPIKIYSDFFAVGTGGTTERMRVDSSGNVGIGTTANASAILDVQSTTKGFRLPNMTTVQKNAIAGPVAGLMVFDTTLAKACVYSGAAWQTITSV